MGIHKPETRKRLNAEYRERNIDKIRKGQKDKRVKIREEIFERYGKECCKCGYSDLRALQIDHVNNDGFKERKELGGQQVAGYRFYLILKARGFPDGYQTLCANCNLIKHIESKNEGVV